MSEHGMCLAIILAAGLGTRMKSAKPKVMHPVGGEPMIVHVLRTAMAASDRRAVVIGPGMDALRETILSVDPQASIHIQTDRLGTAHAALAARAAVSDDAGDVLVMFGDSPLLKPATLQAVRSALRGDAVLGVSGFRTDHPTGYGRLVVGDGNLVAIREEAAASAEEKRITLCNSGVMAFSGAHFLPLVDAIGNDNPKAEYFLTDVVEVARAQGLRAVATEGPQSEFLGVNSRAQLAEAEAEFQLVRRLEIMDAGVTLVAPETVFFSAETEIGPDSLVEPHVVFLGKVRIGAGATVRAFSHIEGTDLADGVTVGPYARLRPGTRIAEGARIGNFVETKAAEIGPGAKVNHLSYIGDASVGANANIGAGTITCNYDGFTKSRTEIGPDAFVGSNSALVAPVSIGAGSYVGSGSVVTKDVAPGALAVARGRQANIDGWAASFRAKHKKNG